MTRFTRRSALWLLGIAAALAAGCAGEARRPYESMPSAEEAARLADVVVEGEVTTSEGAERVPVSTTESNLSGGTNIDCIRKTRVTMTVARVLKGPEGFRGPVDFWFFAPCYAQDPEVLLGSSLPPAMKGSRLRVFLENRRGEWWLIAHEKWLTPAKEMETSSRSRPMVLPPGRAMELPAAPAAAPEAAVSAAPGEAPGAVPVEGLAPGQPVAPAPPARPTAVQPPATPRGEIVTPPPSYRPSSPTPRSRFVKRPMDRWWP